MTKFYKTEFKIVILSEDPIEDINLDDITRFVNEGDGVLSSFKASKTTYLTPKETVKELYDASSEPGFFSLDDNGKAVK